MIVLVYEENSVFRYEIHGNKRIPVLKGEIEAVHKDSFYHLLPDNNLSCNINDITCDAHVICRKKGADQKADLFFLMHETSGWECYEMKEIVSIGSDPHDDIYLHTPLCRSQNISIDSLHRTIHYKGSYGFGYDGRRVREECTVKDGVLLSFLNLEIIIVGNMLYCRQTEDVHVNLRTKKDEVLNKVYPLAVKQKIYGMIPSIRQEVTITIKSPDITRSPDERMISGAFGTSVLMAAASLAAGLVSLRRILNSGGEILDGISLILFPCVMLVSVFLFQPLSRYINKRRRRKKTDAERKMFEVYLTGLHEKIRQFIYAYRKSSAEWYPLAGILASEWISHSFCYVQRSDAPVLVRCGERMNLPKVHFKRTWEETDSSVQKMLKVFEQQAFDGYPSPWLLDILQYQKILILKGNKQYDLMMNLVIQTVCRYELPVIFFFKDAESEKQLWMRRIPQVYDNGRRLIAVNQSEFMQIAESMKQEKCICFTDHMIDVSCMDHIHLIMMQDESREIPCDLYLDADQGIYRDTVNLETGEFIFNDENIPVDEMFQGCPISFGDKKDHSFLSVHQASCVKDLHIEANWKQNHTDEHLCACIGLDQQNRRITLDLNERKDGPHGLVAGMTGSGKSEFLLNMILSLAVNYAPREVQFVLIDFKGGGAFSSLASSDHPLPHIAGCLTNLDEMQMNRALVSFHIECERREKLFSEMSQITKTSIMNIKQYRKQWKKDSSLPYLSDLIIIVDEFAELKKLQPGFLNELVSLSRIGRSLGLHLILCTQKPGGVVNDQIWSNCSFKVCMKVADRQDSYEMLHHDRAVKLHQTGSFILQCQEYETTGMAGYVNTCQYPDSLYVKIRDHMGRITSCRSDSSGNMPQIAAVLQEMSQIEVKEQAYPLWLNELEEISLQEVVPHKRIIGTFDDYYHRRQCYLRLKKHQNVLVIARDYDERKNMFQVMLQALQDASGKNEQIIVLDTLIQNSYTDDKTLYYSYGDEQGIRDLWMQLTRHKHNSGAVWLLITDLSVFRKINPVHMDSLHELLEHSTEKNIQIILFAPSIHAVSYRDLSFIKERIVVGDVSLPEIQQTLDTGEKVTSKNKGWGLIKREHVLVFRRCSNDGV